MNNQEQINQLIEASDKATQGDWEVDTGMEVITDKGCTVAYPHDEMFIDENFEDNMNFITQAANTREAVKAMAAENERIRKRFLAAMQAIKNIDDMSEYSKFSRKEFERECEALTVKLGKLKGEDDE